MPEPEKNAGGRPTKLTEDFLAAMFDVLHDVDNALIYTDEELLALINDKLPLEARICGDTFSLWKNGKIDALPRQLAEQAATIIVEVRAGRLLRTAVAEASQKVGKRRPKALIVLIRHQCPSR